MAIEFRCNHCQQRLAAPERRAGKRVRCPRCRELISVPSGRAEATAGEEGGSTVGSRGALQVVGGLRAPQREVPPGVSRRPRELPRQQSGVHAGDSGAADGSGGLDDPPVISLESLPGRSTMVVGESITVTRTVVFIQGLLLAATAGVFFLAGIWVGRSGHRASSAVASPCEVSGRVVWKGTGGEAGDGGAVVMLLPMDHRPDAKLDPATVRPGAGKPSGLDPAVQAVRRWGGDYVRADARGRFRLKVPRGGTYFLLVVSAHAERRATRPRHRDLAQLGRYFLPAVDLLETRAYSWTTQRLDGDLRLDPIVLEDER